MLFVKNDLKENQHLFADDCSDKNLHLYRKIEATKTIQTTLGQVTKAFSFFQFGHFYQGKTGWKP